MQLFAQHCCFTCSTCYATNIATRNKEILLRDNLVVADYQQCCAKSCMNLLPILSHLYHLRYSLQSKSTLLIDQFPRALLKKMEIFYACAGCRPLLRFLVHMDQCILFFLNL